MRKIAVIDLGTNTFHVLIAKAHDDVAEILHREKVAVKIGEGGINEQIIIEEAQNRAIAALKHFKSVCEKYDVREIYATATSAIRNASNSAEITDKIYKETGIHVRVISGEEEAELIYGGVKKALSMEKEKSLIMDIGGGSVEFLIADDVRSYYKQSFEIGAQRLLDLFHHHDPMLPEELKQLEEYLLKNLAPLTEAVKTFKPVTLIGSSGSFDTLSDIYCQANQIYRHPDATEYPLTTDSFFKIYKDILSKNKAARMNIPGMISLRVDMIVVACTLISFVLNQYKIKNIRVSSYALKEGLLDFVLRKDPVNHPF